MSLPSGFKTRTIPAAIFSGGYHRHRLGQNQFGIWITALVGTIFASLGFLFCADNHLVFISNLYGSNSKWTFAPFQREYDASHVYYPRFQSLRQIHHAGSLDYSISYRVHCKVTMRVGKPLIQFPSWATFIMRVVPGPL